MYKGTVIAASFWNLVLGSTLVPILRSDVLNVRFIFAVWLLSSGPHFYMRSRSVGFLPFFHAYSSLAGICSSG